MTTMTTTTMSTTTNPYALPSGETPGRLGKAWKRGYEGLPPSKSWTRGSAAWNAYQEGKSGRATDQMVMNRREPVEKGGVE